MINAVPYFRHSLSPLKCGIVSGMWRKCGDKSLDSLNESGFLMNTMLPYLIVRKKMVVWCFQMGTNRIEGLINLIRAKNSRVT